MGIGQGGEEVPGQHYPRDHAGEGAAPERRPAHLLPVLVVPLHHQAEQVHRRGKREQHYHAGGIIDPAEHADDDHHQRGAQGVFIPSQVVDVLLQVAHVPLVEPRRSHYGVRHRRYKQEPADQRSNRYVRQGVGRRFEGLGSGVPA